MIRRLLKTLTHPVLKFGTQCYFSKPRKYVYDGIEVLVMPEVFPPQYTLSTKILLDFIKDIELADKTLLELGCGSGIISLLAASKGAIVTASDINSVALEALEKASNKNKLKLKVINSDLFNNIPHLPFDYVIINPPYYPKKAKNIKEQAWFCGEDFEYYKELFKQLAKRQDKIVYMILSQDCDIETIKNIGHQNELQFHVEQEFSTLGERHFIFRLVAKRS